VLGARLRRRESWMRSSSPDRQWLLNIRRVNFIEIPALAPIGIIGAIDHHSWGLWGRSPAMACACSFFWSGWSR
jgi:hypothetical protein